MSEGSRAFHDALDAVPDNLPASERIRLALRAHLRVVSEQLDVATVFVREWRYLEGDRAEEFLAERRRRERFRALFREGREAGRPHGPRRPGRGAARPLGGELGVHLAASPGPTRTSWRTGSSRSSWTASGVLNAGLNERGAGFPAPRFVWERGASERPRARRRCRGRSR